MGLNPRPAPKVLPKRSNWTQQIWSRRLSRKSSWDEPWQQTKDEGFPTPIIFVNKKTGPERHLYEVNWNCPLTKGLVGCYLAGDIRSSHTSVVNIVNQRYPLTYLSGTTTPKIESDDERIYFKFNADTGLRSNLVDWYILDPVTALVWVRWDGNSGVDPNGRVWGAWDGIGYASWTIDINNTGPRFDWAVHDGSTTQTLGVGNLNVGKWHFLCGTNNNGSAQGYIDGKLQATGTLVSSTGSPSSYVFIGAAYAGGLRAALNGGVDMCLVFNRILSDAEIEEIYNQTRNGSYGDLVRPVHGKSYVFVTREPLMKPKKVIVVRKIRRPV